MFATKLTIFVSLFILISVYSVVRLLPGADELWLRLRTMTMLQMKMVENVLKLFDIV